MLVRRICRANFLFSRTSILELIIIIVIVALLALIIIAISPTKHARSEQLPEKLNPISRDTLRQYRFVAKKVEPIKAEKTPTQHTLTLPPIPESMEIKGKAYVIDGDTIRIKSTKIRLFGIDAPEEDQSWGRKSKWAMLDICRGQIITVSLNGTRSYDRLVGTCFLPDGTDIGAEIVKRGLALDLPEFSYGKYRDLEPVGARRRLANGKFGHKSLRTHKLNS